MKIEAVRKEGRKMLAYRYDTQLLIEGKGLKEGAISEYFEKNFKGDCLLAVGDEELIKIHVVLNERRRSCACGGFLHRSRADFWIVSCE